MKGSPRCRHVRRVGTVAPVSLTPLAPTLLFAHLEYGRAHRITVSISVVSSVVRLALLLPMRPFAQRVHTQQQRHTSHRGIRHNHVHSYVTSLTQPGSASLSAPLHVKTRIVPVEAERHSGHSAQVCSDAQSTHRHRCEHGSSRTARGSWVVEFTRQ